MDDLRLVCRAWPRSRAGQNSTQHGPAITRVSNHPLDDEFPVVTEVVVKQLPLVTIFSLEHADLAESTSSDPAPNLESLTEKKPAVVVSGPGKEA